MGLPICHSVYYLSLRAFTVSSVSIIIEMRPHRMPVEGEPGHVKLMRLKNLSQSHSVDVFEWFVSCACQPELQRYCHQRFRRSCPGAEQYERPSRSQVRSTLAHTGTHWPVFFVLNAVNAHDLSTKNVNVTCQYNINTATVLVRPGCGTYCD
jgi:hypothetical protein